ncbi:hypothetical protein HAZT_HAZT003484 [Hyalella azteca]|uniref:C1q domain-containing protein n=1 Tax=Hyalella azteca TaxID=294128 RepID=A0A6A0H6R0_HYAAZ|nr:hypothetical protein HAZT_HAZT003484 [Hyalella azteca]
MQLYCIWATHSAEAQISLHRSIDRNYDSSLQQRVSRRLLSSSIVTPISPELEHDPMAATVLGGINRIGRSTVQAAELLSLTTDVQQKRHLVNQGGNVVLNQNEQPLVLNTLFTFYPSSRPCVAAFSVRKGIAQDTDKSKPRRLTFQDVLTNTGGWSKKRQQFETPCTGLYFFSFHAISAKDSDFTIALMKDGHFQVTAYGGKDGYQWGANSVLLFLNPGENVYLELQQGEIYEHPYEEAYTTFSGFLINSL